MTCKVGGWHLASGALKRRHNFGGSPCSRATNRALGLWEGAAPHREQLGPTNTDTSSAGVRRASTRGDKFVDSCTHQNWSQECILRRRTMRRVDEVTDE